MSRSRFEGARATRVRRVVRVDGGSDQFEGNPIEMSENGVP